MKRYYLSNINFGADEGEVKSFFEEYGEIVDSVQIITEKESGDSRGFGFITVQDRGADDFVAAYDGVEFQGRVLHVAVALPREKRASKDSGGKNRKR